MSYETRYAAHKHAQADARANSPAAVAWRLRDNAFREQAKRERNEAYPEITVDNFRDAIKWFDERVKQLHAEAGSA